MTKLYFKIQKFTFFPLTIIIQYITTQSSKFYVQDFIEIPSFYHQQWAPNYPESVQLRYNGATYQIQLQQHRDRFFLPDGLTDFRTDLEIYESIIINFFACNHNSIFDVYFTPPLDQQTCARPLLHSRQHIWTEEITQCILGAPHPLVTQSHYYFLWIICRKSHPMQQNISMNR